LSASIRRQWAISCAKPNVTRGLGAWDGQPAGGEGGTGDFAGLAERFRAPLAIVNPTLL
jgi:hypothetical protein